MSQIPPQTSLASLEGVVIDSETTGLDARTARIIQLGAINIGGGKMDGAAKFDRLIDPGVPIPPETTAVHGLSDASVRGHPKFETVGREFFAFVGSRPIIGHTIQFDIAMLRRECGLAGIDWQPQRVLDVRLLGRLAAPTLAAYDLDRLCSWLGVSNPGRHTALGDAIATAEVFLKLVPLLRQAGIRTIAEAEAACVELTEKDARSAGGLMLVEPVAFALPQALSKLDSFAYRHRVCDVMSAPARIVPGNATLSEATKLMIEHGLSSVFVDLGNGQSGIVTERDALRAFHANGKDASDREIAAIARTPLISVDEHDFVYRAIGRMDRHSIRHLAVRGTDNQIVGALTPRNLLRNRATSTIVIGDRIAGATTPADLSAIWAEISGMATALVADGVSARDVAGVISAEVCAITSRAAEFAVEELERSGKGRPPCAYAVLVLGSAGRGESLLAADQDNALVFAEGEAGGPEDLWFEQMAIRMNGILDEAGIVLCKGGVMAQNAQWRHSRKEWEKLIASWVRRQNPKDLLNVDIFFDAATVHGERSLGDEIIADARRLGHRSPDFLMMLTELARQWRSPVNLLGGFQKTDGRIDLKKFGLMPIFTAARVLALRHGVHAQSTAERLRGVLGHGTGAPQTVEDIIASHEFLLRRVLEQQLLDITRGIQLSPRVDVDRLGKAEKRRLKQAFDSVSQVIDLVSEGRL